MYGAAAGLPPTLARFGDSTPTVMNDYPICISVSIENGAPPPYPKEGSGPRACGGDQLAGALRGGAGARARAPGESPLGRRPLARTGLARARPTARSDQVPLRPKQRANLRGPLCMGARVDARTIPYKMGPPPARSGPGNVCTHDDGPVEVGGSMWKARAASPLVACELCAGHFFPARQAASL